MSRLCFGTIRKEALSASWHIRSSISCSSSRSRAARSTYCRAQILSRTFWGTATSRGSEELVMPSDDLPGSLLGIVSIGVELLSPGVAVCAAGTAVAVATGAGAGGAPNAAVGWGVAVATTPCAVPSATTVAVFVPARAVSAGVATTSALVKPRATLVSPVWGAARDDLISSRTPCMASATVPRCPVGCPVQQLPL